MTVHSGRGWRLAPSLVALEAEANRAAPRRSQASDGSIGDAAHRARGSRSDHNPSGGYVHALDLTHDPGGGFDAHGHGRRIAERRDPRVKYLISNGRIWHPGVGWSGYGGANPHRTHLHVSIHHTPAARDDLRPWLGGTSAPSPIPTPAPVAPPLEPPEEPMWLLVEGKGHYFVAPGGGVIGFPTKEQWEAARAASSPSIPTVKLTGFNAAKGTQANIADGVLYR